MKLIIHRGTHEIGGSCVEIEDNGSRIVIDIGMPLVKPNGERFDIKDFKNLTGPQLVQKKILPDIKGIYPWDISIKSIDGLLISHAHMDHYGLYSYVRDDLSYFMGEGTKKLIDISNLFLSSQGTMKHCTHFKNGQGFHVGTFKVTPYLMDHSAFDAYAFLVESGDKKIFYSGDFRSHGRKSKTFKRFLNHCPEEVDALLLEGSLVSRDDNNSHQKSEQEIQNEIETTIRVSDKIIFAIQSSQNIDRAVSFFKAALKTKRLFVIDIYTAHILNTLKDHAKLPYASDGFSNIRVFYPYRLCSRLTEMGHQDILYTYKRFKITKDEISKHHPNIVMLIRPTMIEDLSRLGDIDCSTIIYSMWEGYLKEHSMDRFLQFAKKHRMKMIAIHTSGHADIETLKAFVNNMKPKKIIPIHTFKPEYYPSLFHNVISALDGVEIII